MDVRILERRQQVRDERRQRRLGRTLLIVTLLAVVGLLLALEQSSLVALAEVRVTGTHRLDVATVREAADLPLGSSTLRLRLGDAESRVEALPLVADADARRVDPLTVEIAVVERTPVAVVTGRGAPVLMDDDGVVVMKGREKGLPVIDLGGAAPPAVGETAKKQAALANAHRVLRELSGPLRARVTRYEAPAEDELTLVLDQNTQVFFGRAARIEEKVRALGAVLEDLEGTAVKVIDVRAPRTPVVEP